MDFKDKVVVITGAGKGFGMEMASAFTAKGAKVLKSDKNDGVDLVADVTVEADMKNLASQALERFGRIDMWINNAGVWIPLGPIEELDIDRVRVLMEVNVIGTINGTKAVLPIMRSQGIGVIVNIISTAALGGRANMSAYCASKFAAAGFTESLQAELKGSGVRAVAIYPGGMQTNLFDEKKPPDFDKYMETSHVVGKVLEFFEKEPLEDKLIIKRPEVV